ncbi:MAG: hypothetical protein Q4C22_08155 [Bacillota bacterium]|nr:hypothetical protein [Bacillota bacterium]
MEPTEQKDASAREKKEWNWVFPATAGSIIFLLFAVAYSALRDKASYDLWWISGAGTLLNGVSWYLLKEKRKPALIFMLASALLCIGASIFVLLLIRQGAYDYGMTYVAICFATAAVWITVPLVFMIHREKKKKSESP